jgi:hypothetical protein
MIARRKALNRARLAHGGQRLGELLDEQERIGGCGSGKEQNERKSDKSEFGYNVNLKMRFKVNFPPTFSQAREHNF